MLVPLPVAAQVGGQPSATEVKAPKPPDAPPLLDDAVPQELTRAVDESAEGSAAPVIVRQGDALEEGADARVGVLDAVEVPSGPKAPTRVPDDRPTVATADPLPVAAAPREGSGFDPWESREDVSKRDSHSTTYANPDGTKTSEVTPAAQHYKDEDGDWVRIDSTLTAGLPGTTVPYYRNTAGPFRVEFAKRLDEAPLAKLRLPMGASVAYRLIGAAPVTAHVSGNRATYVDALPGVDVVVEVTRQGFKESIVLKDPSAAAASLRFELTLDGVTAQLVNGVVQLIATSGEHEDEVVATIPAGVMYDALGAGPVPPEGRSSHAVTYALDGNVLQVLPDVTWLAEPTRAWPVTVDPTTNTTSTLIPLQSADDTTVWSNGATGWSSAPDMYAGSVNGLGSLIFVKWSTFSPTWDHVHVYDADLQMFLAGQGDCGTNRWVTAWRVMESWSGNTLTSWPGASVGGNYSSLLTAGGEGCPRWLTWSDTSMTDMVENWTHFDLGGYAHYGFSIWPGTSSGYDSDSLSARAFWSTDTDLQPRLVVSWNDYEATYTPVGPLTLPLNNAQGSQQITLQNRGIAGWTANGTAIKLAGRIFNADGSDELETYTPIKVAIPTTTNYSQSVTVTGQIPALPPGTYRVQWDLTYKASGADPYFSDQNVGPIQQQFTVPYGPPVIDSSSVSSGTTLTPTLSVTAHDTDGLGTLKYKFKVCSGTDGNSGSCTTSGSSFQTSNQWTVPAGFMRWRRSYYWTVEVTDQSAPTNAKFAAPGRITSVVPQPTDGAHVGEDVTSVASQGVNLFNGNFAFSAVDASIAGVGPAPVLERVYNSAETRSAASLPFGAGWSSTYDMSVTTEGNGNVVVTFADGHKSRFGKNPDGTFGAPAAMDTMLTGTQAGGYTLTDVDRRVFTFGGSDGPLTSITDSDGHAMTLSYSSGKLQTVTSQVTGRVLTFAWTGSHVTSVSTPAIAANSNQPYTWTYGYSGDKLIEVCGPKSATACTDYTYTTVSSTDLLSTVSLPEGNTPVKLSYNGDKTVAWRKDGYDRQWTYAYATVNGSRSTTVTDPDGKSAILGYDAKDRLTTRVDEDGNTTRTAYNDLGYPSELTDPNGNVTSLAYDERGNLVRRTLPRTSGANFSETISAGTAPTGWWRLGDSAGTTAKDKASGNHDGTYQSSPALNTLGGLRGDVNGAVVLNGSSQYVRVPHGTWANITGNLTLEAWVRPDASAANQTIVAKSNTQNTTAYGLRLKNLTQVEYYHGSTSGGWKTVTGTYAFTPGTWYHVAVRRNGDSADIYVNGLLVVSDQWASMFPPATNSTDLTIGASLASGSAAEYFNGAIQDVLIYNQALSASTIRSHYAAGLNTAYRTAIPTGSIPPTGWWRLGEASGATATDSSGAALHGTYTSVTYGQSGAITGDPATAVNFNGSSSALALPNGYADLASGLTLEAWVYPTDDQRDARIVSLGTSSNGANNVYLARSGTSESLVFTTGYVNGTAKTLVATDAIPEDQWSHLVATIDGLGNGRIYRNGALVASGALPIPTIVTRDSNKIGTKSASDTSSSIQPWEGRIQDVAVYFGALPSSEVGAHYAAATFSGPNGAKTVTSYYDYLRPPYSDSVLTNTPAGYWRLGESSGNVADSSGSNHPGTVHSTVTRVAGGALIDDTNGSITPTSTTSSHIPVTGSGVTLPTTGFTLEAWVNIPDTSRSGAFVVTSGNSTDNVSLGVGSGNITSNGNHLVAKYRNVTGGDFDSGINIGTGWHHVALRVNSGTTADFFLDGDKVATKTSLAPGSSRNSNWSIGGGGTSSSCTCAVGVGIDEAAMYATALSDAALREHYLSGLNLGSDPRRGLVASERDPRSSSPTDNTYKTSYSYDTAGRLTGVTSPATADFPSGRTASTAYTTGSETGYGGVGTMPAGLVKTVTDPRGKVTTYSYDNKGDLRQVTDPLSFVTTSTYDEIGRALTVAANPGGTTTTVWDKLSRPKIVTEPAVQNTITGVTHTRRTTYTYDDNENLTQVEVADTSGGDTTRTTTYAYDDNDRQITVTDAANKTSSRTFDTVGRVATMTDANNVVAEIEYTAASLRKKVTLKNFVDDPYANGGSGTTPRDVILEQYAYDPAGRLAQVSDALGHVRTMTYTDDGLLVSTILEDYDKLDTTLQDVVLEARTYDAAGNVLTQTTGDGKAPVTNVWDAASRLTSTTLEPSGINRTRTFVYDAATNVTSTSLSGTSGGGTLTTTTTYDDAGRSLVTTTGGLSTTLVRDARGLVTSETDPRGNTTDLSYDTIGRVVSVQSPQVNWEENGASPTSTRPTVTYGYDTFGGTSHTRDERSLTTTVTFDAMGRPTQAQAPAYTPPGGSVITPTVTYTYDNVGNVKTVTDPRSNTTTFDYDKRNRQIRATGPSITSLGSQVTRTFYDDLDQVVQTNDPSGSQSNLLWDDLGRLRKTTTVETVPSTQNLVTTFDYDFLGNRTKVVTPANETSTATYNAASEQLTSVDALNKTTTALYNGLGRRTKLTDPLGRYTTWTYDTPGRVTEEKQYDPSNVLQTTTTIVPDNNGNPTQVTDPRGYTTNRAFDALDRLTSLTEPVTAGASITTTVGYDKAGNRTRLTDPNSNSTIFTFNTLGLLESRIEPSTTAYPNAADRTWTTSYDAAGLPTTDVAPGGVTTTRTFNQAGWLTAESGSGGGSTAATRGFGYDIDGNVTSIGHPSSTINLGYNDRGLVVSGSGGAGSSSFAYDADGRMTSRTDAAGTTTFTWTARSQLATVADPLTGQTQTNTYDDAGQLTSMTYGSGKASRAYTYDALGRLTADTLKNGSNTTIASVGYGYDANGNVTTKTIGPAGAPGVGTNTYTYDRANRMLSWTNPASTVTNYTWDGAGNRLTAGSTTSTYDERNRLASATTSGTTTTYTYTARGTRATSTTSGTTINSTFDAFDRVVTDGSTNYSYDSLDRLATAGGATFTYGSTEQEPTGDGTWLFARDPFGAVAALKKGAGTGLAGMTDRHGDLIATYSPTGSATTDGRAYDPWGNPIATAGTNNPTLGYQGQWTDTSNGDTHMGARWYDSATGTFTSNDSWTLPLDSAANVNRQGYGNANPLTYYDPTGHFGIPNPVDMVKDAARGAVNLAKRAARAAKDAAGAAADAAEWAYNAAGDAAEWTYNAAIDAAEWTYNAAIDAGQWIYNAALDAFEWVWNAAVDAAEWAWNAAGDAVEWAWNAASDAVDAAGEVIDWVTAGVRAADRTPPPADVATPDVVAHPKTVATVVATTNTAASKTKAVGASTLIDPCGNMLISPGSNASGKNDKKDGRRQAAPPVVVGGNGCQSGAGPRGGTSPKNATKCQPAISVTGPTISCSDADVLDRLQGVIGGRTTGSRGNGLGVLIATGFGAAAATSAAVVAAIAGMAPGTDEEGDRCSELVGKIGPYGSLPRAPGCERHHIIQQVAVNGGVVDHYKESSAPAIIMTTAAHRLATNAQDRTVICGATYEDERQVAANALLVGGVDPERRDEAIRQADEYFKGQLGLGPSSQLRLSRTRRNC